ncbi:hypothetical protein EASAB2608_00250 [Streptomyces sp. EAS-AB2608]|nr:hypothetical protein EASAB2608_00250 [Streptomyces sp. EAS-AB2608]
MQRHVLTGSLATASSTGGGWGRTLEALAVGGTRHGYGPAKTRQHEHHCTAVTQVFAARSDVKPF